MAKRVKMKKGSIGKKALAAILAASMVLSSSAFSVLAAEAVSDAEGDGAVTASVEPVEVIDSDAGIAPASLNEENGIMTTALPTNEKILLGFVDKDGKVVDEPEKLVYNTNEQHPNVVAYHCKDRSHTKASQCATGGSGCEKLDNQSKQLYTVSYGNAVNARKGYIDENGSNQGRQDKENAFVKAGPYVCVNFSDNQLSGAGNNDNIYANLGSYYISFDIEPVDLDDVDVAITELQYGWTYNGREVYPGMTGINVTLGGKTIKLEEGKDYIALPASAAVHTDELKTYSEDLITASELNKSNTNNPKDDKRVVLVGMNGVKLEGDEEARTGNFKGTLGDEHYNGDSTNKPTDGYCGLRCNNHSSNYKYPSEQSKTNDRRIVYHINQRTKDSMVKIDENIKIVRKVGEVTGTTRADFIKILNGGVDGNVEASATAKVYDTRRAATDGQYYMTCDNGNNTAKADYTVLFEQPDKTWGVDPDASTGTHRFKITTTGYKDYKKGGVEIGNYTVENPSRLQRAAEDKFVITYKGKLITNKTEGSATASIPYDGTDHYPTKWNETSIQIGNDISELVYGVDYKVSSAKEEWKDANTYTLKLQGLSGISDETAEIKVTITPRNINELSSSKGVLDKVQFADNDYYKVLDGQTKADKNGKNGNETTVPKTSKYNIENTKKVDESILSGTQRSVVRVLAEQGVHTTSAAPTETIVEITDSGLDPTVGNNGEVTLVEGKDYTVETKTRADGKTKYVEITGINNYTTDLYDGATKVATVYEEDIDVLEKMPLNSNSITASVVPETWEIKQRDQKIQLKTSDIKMKEVDPGSGNTKDLDSKHFIIKGYEQDGTPYTQEEGITKPGKAYVIVGPTVLGGYINEKKIPFTVTGVTFGSKISIDPLPAYELLTGDYDANYIDDVLDDAIVVRYAEDPDHPTFSKSDYDVTVKDPDGDIVAIRDKGEWKVPSDSNSTGYVTMDDNNYYELKLGTYKVIVESRDNRYEGTAETDFVVIGKNIASLKGLNVSYQNAWTYTGNAIEPPVTVTADNVDLVEGVDYTVTYSSNVNVGLGLIVLNGTGVYSGFVNNTFTIEGVTGTIDVEASQRTELAAGVAVGAKDTLKVVAYVDGKQVAENVDYTLTSDTPSVVEISADGRTMNYKAKGTAKITVTPKGGNVKADSITITVNVTEEDEPTIKTPTFTPSNNISKKARTFTVTTSTIKGASEWEIRYSLNDLTKTEKGSKYVTVKNTSKVKRYVVKCNKSKRKYYIRVRACVNGKWSAWSPQKSIKSR